MLLKAGDKLLIVHRRLFEKDGIRFFAGVVDDFESGIVKVTGVSFFQDMMTGHLQKKRGDRTKIVAIGSGTVLVYLVDSDTQMDRLHFVHAGKTVALTDGDRFELDLTEH